MLTFSLEDALLAEAWGLVFVREPAYTELMFSTWAEPASAGVLHVSDSRKSSAYRRRERVERLIARLFAEDSEHRRHAQRIRARQLELRGALSVSAWQLYLLLEEAEVGRWTYVVDRLAERVISAPRSRLLPAPATRATGKRRSGR